MKKVTYKQMDDPTDVGGPKNAARDSGALRLDVWVVSVERKGSGISEIHFKVRASVVHGCVPKSEKRVGQCR